MVVGEIVIATPTDLGVLCSVTYWVQRLSRRFLRSYAIFCVDDGHRKVVDTWELLDLMLQRNSGGTREMLPGLIDNTSQLQQQIVTEYFCF